MFGSERVSGERKGVFGGRNKVFWRRTDVFGLEKGFGGITGCLG